MGPDPPPFFMTNTIILKDITGVILGGGKSVRMGRDKRRLQWEGESFLDRIARIMASLFDEVILVTAIEDYDCSQLPVRLVTDKIPDKGALGGLYTGLLESQHPFVFVVACDMPFLNIKTIERLCLDHPTDVLVAELFNRVHSLHARYSQKCLPVIESMIKKGDLTIQNLVSSPQLHVKIIDQNFFHDIDSFDLSFNNINTPADLKFARKRLSQASNLE